MNKQLKDLVAPLQEFFSSYGKLLFGGILFVSSVTLFILLTSLVTPAHLRITFVDVGQGDAILIQTPSGHDMLIDGGPDDRVLEGLRKKMSFFDHHLDVVLATHPDADHITGLVPLLSQHHSDHVILSPATSDTGVYKVFMDEVAVASSSVHIGTRGDQIDFGDGVVVTLLYPGTIRTWKDGDTNDASLVTLVTYGSTTALLTGDLPSNNEDELIALLPHDITIYKAGHHGSKYSSGDQLLSYIRPEYAVVSAGLGNRYSHPHTETLERLQHYAKEILSTITSGTITFATDGSSVWLSTEK